MSGEEYGVAVLPNVVALQALADKVQNRHLDLPGMAVFYGPSGHGKTVAGHYVGNRLNAVVVECRSTWAKKDLCAAILKEMGHRPKGRIHDMSEKIAETLVMDDRVLIVDEADFLIQKKMIEILRDIHEMSKTPVILIGEEQLPQKLTAWERIHNRVLDWVRAEEATLHDVQQLAKIYLTNATLTEEFAQRVLRESERNIRRICVNLNSISSFAALQGLETVSLNDWGKRPLFTGIAPHSLGTGSRRRVAS